MACSLFEQIIYAKGCFQKQKYKMKFARLLPVRPIFLITVEKARKSTAFIDLRTGERLEVREGRMLKEN